MHVNDTSIGSNLVFWCICLNIFSQLEDCVSTSLQHYQWLEWTACQQPDIFWGFDAAGTGSKKKYTSLEVNPVGISRTRFHASTDGMSQAPHCKVNLDFPLKLSSGSSLSGGNNGFHLWILSIHFITKELGTDSSFWDRIKTQNKLLLFHINLDFHLHPYKNPSWSILPV